MEENREKLQVAKSKPVLLGELVEKIVAMMPFPRYTKPEPWQKSGTIDSSHPRHNVKRAGTLQGDFKRKCFERSRQWETLCPVLVAESGICFGYHRATESWKEMPQLPFLPYYMFGTTNFQMEGALLLAWKRFPFDDIYVINLLTGERKQLPSIFQSPHNRSVWYCLSFCVMLVINTSLQTYHLFKFSQAPPCIQSADSLLGSNHKRKYFVQVYYSQIATWTSRSIEWPGQFRCSPRDTAESVYMDGMINLLARESGDILIYSIEEGAFKRFQNELSVRVTDRIMIARRDFPSSRISLIVCDHGLLIVTLIDSDEPVLMVHKIDLELQRVSAVGTAHRLLKWDARFMRPVADSNCIFFPVVYPDGSMNMITYNLVSLEWKSSSVHSTIMEGKLRKRYEGRGEEFPEHFRVGVFFSPKRYHFHPGLTPFVNL